MGFPVFRPVSDHGLLVEFGEIVDEAVHAAVLGLDRALAEDPVPGQREVVPAYVNLLVVFDPLATDHAAVTAALRDRLRHRARATLAGPEHVVEVCYDDECGRDLAEVAQLTGMSAEEVVAAHLAGDYAVYLYGFAPGYAYLGGVPAPIRLPRKAAPVRGIPAGSVIVAGPQCIVTTLTMPTGWWVIGRSPTRILSPGGGRALLFDVGDRVRFRRVGRAALG
jgi:inhibitor of KinA